MRRDNKAFVRNVIIASIVGLLALMVILFIIVQGFLQKYEQVQYTVQIEEQADNPKVELSETLVVLVHKITNTGIVGYDIKNDEIINRDFEETTRLSDVQGNVIPITEIKIGDIVEVQCRQEENTAFIVSKSSKTKSWKRISGIMVDVEAQSIDIGGTKYNYNAHTMIIDEDGSKEDIHNIGPYDVVTILVYDNMIWSVAINERAGNIDVSKLPTSEGTIEIDNSRLIQFSDITEPIKVIPGKHRIIVKMPGYVVQNFDLTVTSGEIYKISLGDSEKAYTLLSIMVYPKELDYKVKIGDKVYQPNDEIKIEQGKYEVTVAADGYELWKDNVNLTTEDYRLRAHLTPIETDEEKETEVPKEQVTEANRVVTFETDPTGASIYIDGNRLGETPYTITLTSGSHNILLQKDGYEIYETNIVIDHNNIQNNFLYALTPMT